MKLVKGQSKNHGGRAWISAVWKLLSCRVNYMLLDLSCEAVSSLASASS